MHLVCFEQDHEGITKRYPTQILCPCLSVFCVDCCRPLPKEASVQRVVAKPNQPNQHSCLAFNGWNLRSRISLQSLIRVIVYLFTLVSVKIFYANLYGCDIRYLLFQKRQIQGQQIWTINSNSAWGGMTSRPTWSPASSTWGTRSHSLMWQ